MTAVDEQFSILWIDRHREPQCAPNPHYPNGIDLDITKGQHPHCTVKLPYPAKRCGFYRIDCQLCNFSVAITTAGRPDDPRSIKLPCKRGGE